VGRYVGVGVGTGLVDRIYCYVIIILAIPVFIWYLKSKK